MKNNIYPLRNYHTNAFAIPLVLRMPMGGDDRLPSFGNNNKNPLKKKTSNQGLSIIKTDV